MMNICCRCLKSHNLNKIGDVIKFKSYGSYFQSVIHVGSDLLTICPNFADRIILGPAKTFSI